MNRNLSLSLFIFILVLLPFLLLQPGCEEGITLSVDCNECFTPEPDSFDIVVHLSFNEEVNEIPLTFYRGEADKRKVEWIDTATRTPYYLYVATDMFYSVEAKYILNDKTVIAVDGSEIKTTLVSGVCVEDCYVIKNNVLNARLKN